MIFFYAENIIKNKELVQFLHSFGIDAQKADEAWCYNEENDHKYYSVDFFGVYADIEGTFVFDGIQITIFTNPYAEENEATHGVSIEAMFKI